MNIELLDAIAGVCQRVKRLVACYEEGREPEKLDCLVFHVDRLHRTLLALNTSSEVLEVVGMSLTLLEELDRSVGNGYGYTPLVLHENRRGRPRFDVKQEQPEYLLDLGFNCPKVAEVLGVLNTIRRRMSV